MDCNTVKENLYAFIDGELDSQTSLSVKEHIGVCPLCSWEVEQEKKFNCLLRHNISKDKAPYELKEAIVSQIEDFGKKWGSIFSRPLLKPIMIPVVMGFLVVTLTSFVLVHINKPFPIFSEAIEDHIQSLQGKLLVDIASDKPAEVRKWLQTKLNFKVMVPDLSSQRANLLGARLCTFDNRKIAYILYEINGHSLSVFMFDAKGLKFPKARKVTVNNRIFSLRKEKGYNSALWLDEDIACVFVSEIDEAELLYLASL